MDRRSALALVGLLLGTPAAEAAGRQYLVGYAGPPGAGERAWIEARRGTVVRALPRAGALAVRLEPSELPALRARPGVLYVEEDALRWPLDLAARQLVPALANGLYGLVRTRMTDVQRRGISGDGVVVGVADSALDCGHPDIAPRLVAVHDLLGADAACAVDDAATHGTHVAGIVLAANNRVGVVGGAPGAALAHARVCDGGCRTSAIIAGVSWLADVVGARIVNLSLGGDQFLETEALFYRRLRDQGVLVVAAAGNEAEKPVSFPAGYEGVVAVGATGPDDGLAAFSSRGTDLDLVAPGVGVLSAVPRGTGQDSAVEQLLRRRRIALPAVGLVFAGQAEALRGRLVACGLGRPEEFSRAVRGQIALIQRGELLFSEKVFNAMAAGAAGVVIVNHEPGPLHGTLREARAPDGRPWIPAVGVADLDGERLRRESLGRAVLLRLRRSDWDSLSGTSMAAPHVSAALALLWSTDPAASADEVEARLFASSTDLGPRGWDSSFGHGRLDAFEAIFPSR
ncbi:MAG TPA: S8 family serine peptidase [Thermoanaerobaculia bacterium]